MGKDQKKLSFINKKLFLLNKKLIKFTISNLIISMIKINKILLKIYKFQILSSKVFNNLKILNKYKTDLKY